MKAGAVPLLAMLFQCEQGELMIPLVQENASKVYITVYPYI